MRILMFVLADVLLVWDAVLLVRMYRLQSFTDRLLGVFTFAVAQIILILLAAGRLLHSFNAQTVLAILVLVLAVHLLIYRKTGAKGEMWPGKSWWTGLWREGLQNPLAGGFAVLAILLTVWEVFLAVLLPSHDWDGLFYHLNSVYYWIQENKITLTPFAIWTNVYPQNAHLVYAWLVLFLKSDRIVDIGQLLFVLGGASAVAGIARSIRVSRIGSILSGCLYLLTPVIAAQTTTNYVDAAFGSMFLVAFYFTFRYLQSGGLSLLFMAGLAGGVTLGMKSSSFVYIGILAIVLLVKTIFDVYRKNAAVKQAFYRAAVFVFPLLLLGTYWYLRTWLSYKNPLYPFTISALGHSLFPGQGTINDMIMVPNTPPEILHQPWWKQIWLSWSSEPQPTGYEQRIGGFGLQWLYLLVPSLILFTGYTLWKKRLWFYTLALPFLAIFVLQPSAWWSRYTIFFVAFGAVSFAFWLERIRIRAAAVALQLVCLALVLTSLGYQQGAAKLSAVPTALKLPDSERTLGRLYYPEYRFLDHLPDGTRIAMRFGDFASPFFGRHLQYHVYMLRQATEAEYLTSMKNDKVDYVFTLKDKPYNEWSAKYPDIFKQLEDNGRYRLFQVDQAKLAALQIPNG